MKVKRFNNLWAMGLILCGVLLVAFYVAKIFFPEFIVGVAETPRIVEIGTTIQSNKWLLHLFNLITGYINAYIFSCACCRTYKLNLKGHITILISNLILCLSSEFFAEHYTSINYITLVFIPFLICFFENNLTKETFISTSICFTLDLVFQIMSMLVRNLAVLTTKGNVVTFLIILIDVFIWRIILFFIFQL